MSTEIAAAGLKDEEYRKAAAKQAARTLFRPDNPQENAIATALNSLFSSKEGFQSENLTNDLYVRLKKQYANLIAVDSDKSAILEEGLKPVSSFIGSTLLKLTGMQEDSLGSKFDLPATLSSMLEKTNPQLHAKFKSTYESFNAKKLAEMPSQLFGNAKQLATTGESLSGSGGSGAGSVQGVAGAAGAAAAAAKANNLNLPAGLQDQYRGLENLVGKANEFVTDTIETLQKQLQNLVKLVPKELTQILGNSSQFTGQIDGLVKEFGNIEQLKGITDKLNLGNLDFDSLMKNSPLDALQNLNTDFGNFGDIGQLTSFLEKNPLQGLMQGGLPDVSGILNKPPGSLPSEPTDTGAIPSGTSQSKPSFSLPDPKEALKGFLPSQITGGLSKLGLGEISGFGLTGNMPFGLEKALEGIGGNVFNTIASKFSGQLPFLASTIEGAAGPLDFPASFPSNEATRTAAPDGSVSYTVDPTSGTVIKPTAPKPVYTGTPPST